MGKIIDSILALTNHNRGGVSYGGGILRDKDGKILDYTEYLKLLIDDIVFGVKTIDYPHHEVHDGCSFYSGDVVQLGSAGVQDYLITVPNIDTVPHFGFEIMTNGILTVEIFEGTDKSGSADQTVFNRNRNSLLANTTIVKKGTTGGTTDGNRIGYMKFGYSQGSNRVAINSGTSLERILKKNTKYIFRITSGTASNDITTRFDWYEEALI